VKYKKPNVVIISPNLYSRYTLTTIYLLRRMDINVSGVISLSLLNYSRFFSEFRRDGFRLLIKIYRKLILKGNENSVRGGNSIVSFMSENNMPFIAVPQLCKKNDIKYLSTSDINSKSVHLFLDEVRPDCIAFTGGGIIRQGVIDRSGKGVINCHMGVLPAYRGMDVVQWPILNQDYSNIGMTTHLMDQGVDTGDILKVTRVNVDEFSNLKSLRNLFEQLMPQILAESCVGLLDGSITPSSQFREEGIQYFICNQRLAPFVDENLYSNHIRKLRKN